MAARLRAAGCVFAEDEAALLLDAAGQRGDDELDALVARRASGEPLEHVVGWAELCGRRYPVTSGVFVPRVRSELLVRTAAERLPARGAVLVDLCCGSGALGAATVDVASAAAVELHAADIDPDAASCARPTVEARGGSVYLGDLFAALPVHLRGRVDVLVANVPYVATADIATLPTEARDHEPRHTLDGGADGLDLLRRVAGDAPDWLAPGGTLLFEVAEHQLASALAACTAAGLTAAPVRDPDLEALVVTASLPQPSSPTRSISARPG